MEGHLRSWKFCHSIIFVILGVLLIFMFSTFSTDAEEQDVESLVGKFIPQLPNDIPDFIARILEEEGVNLEDLMNEPELRRKIREKVMDNPDIREAFQKRAFEKQMRGKSSQRKSDSKNGGVINEYYKSIVDKNLFRSLGWDKKKKYGSAFRLIGTVISKDRKPRALIFTKNTTHYVSTGDHINNATVKSIDDKSVTLNKNDGKLLKLNLIQESPFLSGSTREIKNFRRRIQ